MSDGSDRCLKSITLYNNLILNELKRKVIDSRKIIIVPLKSGHFYVAFQIIGKYLFFINYSVSIT